MDAVRPPLPRVEAKAVVRAMQEDADLSQSLMTESPKAVNWKTWKESREHDLSEIATLETAIRHDN